MLFELLVFVQIYNILVHVYLPIDDCTCKILALFNKDGSTTNQEHEKLLFKGTYKERHFEGIKNKVANKSELNTDFGSYSSLSKNRYEDEQSDKCDKKLNEFIGGYIRDIENSIDNEMVEEAPLAEDSTSHDTDGDNDSNVEDSDHDTIKSSPLNCEMNKSTDKIAHDGVDKTEEKTLPW